MMRWTNLKGTNRNHLAQAGGTDSWEKSCLLLHRTKFCLFQFNSSILRPPQLPSPKREELMAEMRAVLDDYIADTLTELKYPADMAEYQVGSC